MPASSTSSSPPSVFASVSRFRPRAIASFEPSSSIHWKPSLRAVVKAASLLAGDRPRPAWRGEHRSAKIRSLPS